jgi:hypothetical protein
MRKASWILLTVLGVATLLISFLSANLAYSADYPIGGTSIVDVAQGREAVLAGLRGVRGTSAAFGAAFAVLLLSIVTGPYRRGEKWAWWAIGLAYLVLAAMVALRVPLIGSQLGVGAALTQAAVVLVALLLDVRRLTAPAA